MAPCLKGHASAARYASHKLQDSEQRVCLPCHMLCCSTFWYECSKSLLMRPACMLQDREQIPQWMPWIQSVRVLPEDNRLSRWTLATEQFGQTWELSWVSLNLAPIKNQKVSSTGLGWPMPRSCWCFLSHA